MTVQRDTSIKMMSNIIHFDKYAKYIPELMRRESFPETAGRCEGMHINHYADVPELAPLITEAFDYVRRKEVLPSMRSMQFAGKPVELSNNRIYNCAALPVDNVKAFREIMFLLLGGTGVGYSVQKKHVRKLPRILGTNGESYKYVISDDIVGWSEAVHTLVRAYTKCVHRPIFCYDDIRQKGAHLVTSGGKAPGPAPLRRCLEAIEKILIGAIGRKLSPLEVHDICCRIADAVLAGGIRRAAMISLFSLTDEEMIRCKGNFQIVSHKVVPAIVNNGYTDFDVTYKDATGETVTKRLRIFEGDDAEAAIRSDTSLPWWRFEPQRGRANNSAVITRHRITKAEFARFWDAIQESGSGDPGFYFTNNSDWLTNPCGEVALRCTNGGGQFCNLVEINVDGIKDQADLERRARMAARIGTLQAGYTDFHYIRPIWKEHTEKDALLGISLTGLASGDIDHLDLEAAVAIAIEENIKVSKMIGINPAARVTCIKPSGTAALILGTSSGIHAWFAEYYMRRVRMSKGTPLYDYLNSKVPELMETLVTDAKSACIRIPMKAPEGAILQNDETAIEFLNRVVDIQSRWVNPGHVDGDNKHNVSATVYVDDHEWEAVGDWMWSNKDRFTGLSVLPKDGGTHVQAPFEECDQQTYEELMKHMKSIDLTEVIEEQDLTDLKGELACAAGGCEV